MAGFAMAGSHLIQLVTRNDADAASTLPSDRRLPEPSSLNAHTIGVIREELLARDVPWFLGYSGGKDSSALLKLVYLALRSLPSRKRRVVTALYCDTGVDIPIIGAFARGTLRHVTREAAGEGLPLRARIVEPRLADRYFVKIIGRGYPPPSNKFRWCTDRLRIDPVQRALASSDSPERIVLLGIRLGESEQRDRTLRRHASAGEYFFRQSRRAGTLIFGPLIRYTADDVWATLNYQRTPTSIDVPRLTKLYKAASGECPSVRDPRGAPCGRGRFGCWTCTVVRRDRAMRSMIGEGHAELKPLLAWRDWLVSVRDDPAFRCKVRRNGQPGLGPFTLHARHVILRRLLAAERKSQWRLIRDDELRLIRQLWKKDVLSSAYVE